MTDKHQELTLIFLCYEEQQQQIWNQGLIYFYKKEVQSSLVHLPVGLKHVLDERVFDGQHFWKLLLQLACIHFVVTASSNDNLGLLLQGEVLVCQARVNVLLVHVQDFVVANNARVGEIPDTCEVSLGHLDGDGKQLVKDRHGVRNVHNLIVFCDLGDEIAGGRKVTGDRHPHSQCAHVVKFLQKLLDLAMEKNLLMRSLVQTNPITTIGTENRQSQTRKFPSLLTTCRGYSNPSPFIKNCSPQIIHLVLFTRGMSYYQISASNFFRNENR